jgi:thiamine biosynthesis lipoprotein
VPARTPPIPLRPPAEAHAAANRRPGIQTFPALGTTATVVVADPAQVGAARRIVEHWIADLDRACSRFRENSELTRLNARPGEARPVSPLLLEAVEVALRAARITAGRVSPTVGTAMRLIGYDRDFSEMPAAGPSAPLAPVVHVRPVPGWRMVVADRATSTVRVPAGVELDLGATAKALGADRAAAAAAAAVGCGVLVSLGGDLAVAGPTPEGGWVIRVTDDHAGGTDGCGQTVSIASGGLATSSTTVRRWAGAGGARHHIVDPATGAPAVGGWRTASVLAGTCVDANIASTAAIILGPEAPRWLAERGLAARLVADDGAVVRVGGWPRDPGEGPRPGAATSRPLPDRLASTGTEEPGRSGAAC